MTCDVGPPWTWTITGGSSPSGPSNSGLVGGYQSACEVRPPALSYSSMRGTGAQAGSSGSVADCLTTRDPSPALQDTTASSSVGPAATSTTRSPWDFT